jgi:hypothetical protein
MMSNPTDTDNTSINVSAIAANNCPISTLTQPLNISCKTAAFLVPFAKWYQKSSGPSGLEHYHEFSGTGVLHLLE